MSYFNYLSARHYSVDSSNYGAPSNATINTDSLGDIVLNPSESVIVPQLTLNSDTSGVTNPTIATDTSGDIILTPNTSSSVQIESNLTVVGTTLTLGNTSSGTISTAGNLNLNSGSRDTVQLNGAVCRLGATAYTDVTGNYLAMQLANTATTGNNSFLFETYTSGSTYGLAQMNMYNNSNTAVGTFNIDSENNLNIYNETATTVPSLQLASSGDINLNGPTVIGNSNSSAISNIAFGTYTYSDISNADGGVAYYSSSTINLSFVPSVITLGVSTGNNAIPYAPSLAYEVQATTSGYAYSFQIFLYLPQSNGSNSANYITTYIAIA